MVYVNPLDPTTPSDLADAEEGAARIRELKAAIDERLSTFFSNWPDGDPLEVETEAAPAPVQEGTLAARPNPPSSGGLFYWATDTEQLFLSLAGAPATWHEVDVSAQQAGVGNLSERPNPPAGEGRLYYALDESKMYVSREVEAAPGTYEWITNASTLVKLTTSATTAAQASTSPVTVPISFDLPVVGAFTIGYRIRAKDAATPDDTWWGSWIHDVGASQSVFEETFVETQSVELTSAVSSRDGETFSMLVDIATTSASSRNFDIEAEIVVAAL